MRGMWGMCPHQLYVPIWRYVSQVDTPHIAVTAGHTGTKNYYDALYEVAKKE
jgi:hypothetical protein